MNQALVALISAPLGALLALAGAKVAARRNLFQPVEQEADAELRLVKALVAHPLQWLRVEEVLSESSFATREAREAFAALHQAASSSVLATYSYRGDSDDELDAAIKKAAEENPGLEEELRQAIDPDLRKALSYDDESDPTAVILEAGSLVLTAATGREQNTDRSPLVYDEATDKIIRRPTTITTRRLAITALLGAITAALSAPAVIDALSTSIARTIGLAALAALLFISVEVASVDLDTFYLDTPLFLIVGAASWSQAVLAQIANKHPFNLLAGVSVALSVALAFEVLARLFAVLRGRTQGAGDTWIVLVTCGVPAALTGSWRVGLYAVMAGCLLTIATWSILRARGKATTETPIAFGPYLAAGWALSMAWWLFFAAHP